MDSQHSPANTSTPGKREAKSLNETALDITMKWIDHSSESSELAVGDMQLAESQARAIARFFNVLRKEISHNFEGTGRSEST